MVMKNIYLPFPHQYSHTSNSKLESLNLITNFYHCVIWHSHRIELKGSNFPENLVKVFMGQAVDIARRCVEAPLRCRPKYVRLSLQ